MILAAFKEYNDGYVGMFIGLDTFSKHLTLIPVKDRSVRTLKLMFQRLLQRLPYRLYTITLDQEPAWMGKEIQELFKRSGIHFFPSTSENKTIAPEALIRKLRRVLSRYFLKNNTRRWLDIVSEIEKQHNTTRSSATGFSPMQILSDPSADFETSQKNAALRNEDRAPPDMTNTTGIEKGDFVRISVPKEKMDKESDVAEGTHTFQVFKVDDVNLKKRVVRFQLVTVEGELVAGLAYPWEIIKIQFDPDQDFVIEKIVKRRGRGKNAQALVKWLGYPASHNKWILLSSLKKLRTPTA